MKGILYAIAFACAIYAGAGDLFAATPVYRAYSVTVAQGDTLWSISAKYLGSGAKYMQIFEANRKILSNPNIIKAGQELIIP